MGLTPKLIFVTTALCFVLLLNPGHIISAAKAQTTTTAASTTTSSGSGSGGGARSGGQGVTTIRSGIGTTLTSTVSSIVSSTLWTNAGSNTTPGTSGNIKNNASRTSAPAVPEPIAMHNITKLKLLDVDYLQVYMFPEEDNFEIEIALNLTKFNAISASRRANLPGAAPPALNGNNNQSVQRMQLDLGFEMSDDRQADLIDIVSILLDPMNNGTNNNDSVSTIKDSHWNFKIGGGIMDDEKQDYKIRHFMGNEKDNFYSIEFERPWLTCDENDVRFSLTNMKVYWSIRPQAELSESAPIVEPLKNTTSAISESTTTLSPANSATVRNSVTTSISPITSTVVTPGGGSRSTISSATLNPSPDSVTTPTSSPQQSKSTARPSAGSTRQPAVLDSSKSKIDKSETTKTTPQPRKVKTLQDYSFQGPVNISMSEVFKNFSYLQIKGCGKIFNTLHQCSYPEFQNKTQLNSQSPFFIVKTIHGQRNPNSLADRKAGDCPKAEDFIGWAKTRGKSLQERISGLVENKASSSFAIEPLLMALSFLLLFLHT